MYVIGSGNDEIRSGFSIFVGGIQKVTSSNMNTKFMRFIKAEMFISTDKWPKFRETTENNGKTADFESIPKPDKLEQIRETYPNI